MLISQKRGFRDDYNRASEMIILEIRSGKLGTYTLDRWEELETNNMAKESIQAIKEALLTVTDATDERLASWREDERSGVQQAIKQWERRQLAKEKSGNF